MAGIELINNKETSLLDKLFVARDLTQARSKNRQLGVEFPFPAEGYSTYRGSLKRIVKFARDFNPAEIAAFTIREGKTDIGMAVAEVRVPRQILPEIKPLGDIDKAVEFSYWHHDLPSDEAVEIGSHVFHQLLVKTEALGGQPNSPTKRWMVILPEDEVKAQVCESVHMKPIGEPEVYLIDDNVYVPRQLWAW